MSTTMKTQPDALSRVYATALFETAEAAGGQAPGVGVEQVALGRQPFGPQDTVQRGVAMTSDKLCKSRIRLRDRAGQHKVAF